MAIKKSLLMLILSSLTLTGCDISNQEKPESKTEARQRLMDERAQLEEEIRSIDNELATTCNTITQDELESLGDRKLLIQTKINNIDIELEDKKILESYE